MKKTIFILSLLIMGISLQASTITEIRKASAFTTIRNHCSADIILIQGDHYEIKVIAPEKYIHKIKTTISNKTLNVDITGNIYNADILRVEVMVVDISKIILNGSGDLETKGDIHLESLKLGLYGSGDFEGELHVKDIDITISGSGDVELSGVNNSLKLNQTGSGDFEADDLHLGECFFRMNSSGDVEVSGTAAMMELQQNGSGDFDGRSFKVQTAKIRKTSSGEADVYVNDKLDAKLSGSGSLTIKGQPEITNFSASGSGDIRSL